MNGGGEMEIIRENPENILKKINKEEENSNYGKLKIFFGYAAGVGKTYAMLKSAHSAKKRGVDVVVGYVEPHARPETQKLLEGLELIAPMTAKHKGIELKEFDIDQAISRKPELIIVDELAHTNAEECRHVKRYQDIAELLKAGIDVYTTVNVQHIESLNDIVASITGVMVRERIPDRIFDKADQVELVDIEPSELIDRLNLGKIYKNNEAKKALSNFFSVENLVALREIALRRCADRINKISESVKSMQGEGYYTDEHILVCLSPSKGNAKIVRTAARMAAAFKGSFTAVFVETPNFVNLREEDKIQLRKNTELAEQLGARIEVVYGDDVAFQVAEFARLSSVSKIVLGRSTLKRKYTFGKATLTEKLTAYAPNLDIYVIPNKEESGYYKLKKAREKKLTAPDVAKSSLMLVFATAIGLIFYKLGFSEANTITVYILSVLVTAIITSQRIYSLVYSVLSVLVFNFFFTEPRFTFNAYDGGYPATFLIMFLSAFLTGSLATRIKQNAKQSARTAYRTNVLLETNQLLQKANDKKEIIDVTANQMTKLIGKDIVFYEIEEGQLGEPKIFNSFESDGKQDYISENEKAVAAWVYKNNKHAGATTNTLGSSKCMYLAVRVNEKVYGVVGIALYEDTLDTFATSIMLSILGECALALENQQILVEREQAAIMAKNEQLRANLLRSISHDLRTPLTSISGNAGILLNNESAIEPEKRKGIYKDIYDDSLWLINLVENLLSVTRIEDGTMQLKFTTELIDEIVEEALTRGSLRDEIKRIEFKKSEEFLMAKMDTRLIVQVVTNIVDNALKYTPLNSPIIIRTRKYKEDLIVEVADKGDGIPEDAKDKVFDMFYTVSNDIADSKRSLGLGLALCKSIITAHGGSIYVKDNFGGGSIFGFTLPIEEIKMYE